MSSVAHVAINIPVFPPEKEYEFDEFAERREILKERLSRLDEHQMMLDSVEIEIREVEEKSAKALADFRATQRELSARREGCRSSIGMCNQARMELLNIAQPELRTKLEKLSSELRKHENNFESLTDTPVRAYFVVRIENSQTRDELEKWQNRLVEFDIRKAELDAAVAKTTAEILAL